MFTFWRNIIVHLTILFGPCVVIGMMIDNIVLCLLIACIGLLAWHYVNLYRMSYWLWLKRSITPPKAWGNWDDIFTGIYRLQKNNQRRRAELGKMLKRMRKGIEALPDATILLSKELRIEWCNKLSYQMLGVRLADHAGLRLQDIIVNEEFEHYLRQKKYDEPTNIVSPRSQGKVLEMRVMPYGEQQYLLIARDITSVIKLENMRKDFVANVSHELRTPLTVIQGYLELMQDMQSMPVEMVQKARDTMEEQSGRMRSLIEQLLSISRLESNTENMQRVPVDITHMLARVENEANALNEHYHHELRFNLQCDLAVLGVEAELRSAFTNLVTNAIKYTPENGLIKVYWRRVRNGAEFGVTDSGEGIESRHIQRLTERFYRIDKARSRETGGSGLGLSIVKHVLARHGSRLQIRSRKGLGSTFSFVIPDRYLQAKPEEENQQA